METRLRLRGMTWDHPRGYEPLRACSAEWLQRHGVEIEWDRRSLQDFEHFPVEELAQRYDLIVIDHPHVGQVTREGCLLPFAADGLAGIAAGSVGPSFASYLWQGRQWALPIDAATQVQAWRPDRLSAPLADWDAVRALARAGRVGLPMRAPHSLMCLYTLTAHLSGPAADGDGDGETDLLDARCAAEAYERLRELMAYVDPLHYTLDPIAVFERMAQLDSVCECVPLIYGYVSYAWEGFRPRRIAFADMPRLGGRAPRGSALGGTGIAVSARSAHAAEATAFALWLASAAVQRGSYAAAGGQPGHAAAWEDAAVNQSAGNFYRATRATLDGAWLRPRHDGAMGFQHAASERLGEALRRGEAAAGVIAELNRLHRESLAVAQAS